MKQFLHFLFLLATTASFTQTERGMSLNARGEKEADTGKTYAVITGISRYKNPDIPLLHYADSDAIYFAKFLTTRLGAEKENVKLFLNDAATLKILFELNSLKNKVGAGDRVYIYFSGHGDIETNLDIGGLLLLYESNATNYYENPNGYIQETQLRAALSQLTGKGAEVIFIADACHSGKLSGGDKGRTDNMITLQQKWGKEIKIFSCQPEQTSLEGKQWGNGRGLFSWHFLKGLDGAADGVLPAEPADKKVTLEELERYLKDIVPVQAKPSKQLPFVTGDPYAVLANIEQTRLSDKTIVAQNFSGSEGKKGRLNAATLSTEQLEAYQKFIEATYAGNLTIGNNAALYYLNIMKEKNVPEDIIDDASRTLVAELLKQSTALINPFLQGDEVSITKNKIENTVADMDVALALLGKEHYLWSTFESRRLFLKSISVTLTEADAQKKENINQAVQWLDQSIRLEPYAYYSYFQLGVCYYRKKLPDKAIEYFSKYQTYLPKDADTYNNIGLAYFKMGNLADAVKFIAKALGIDSTKSSYYFNMGNAMCSAQKYTSGIYAYYKALQFSPADVNVAFNLANAYNHTGQNDSALKYYNLVLKAEPEDAQTWFYRGNTLKKMKKYDQSLNSYSSALKLGNNAFRLYYNMACILSLTGDKDNALLFFEESLKRGMSDFVLEIYAEPELSNVKSSPKFSQLMKKYAAK